MLKVLALASSDGQDIPKLISDKVFALRQNVVLELVANAVGWLYAKSAEDMARLDPIVFTPDGALNLAGIEAECGRQNIDFKAMMASVGARADVMAKRHGDEWNSAARRLGLLPAAREGVQ